MKIVFSFAVLLLSVMLCGCLEITTLVRLDEDGSGTIEEQVMISTQFVNMIRMAAESMVSDSEEPQEPFSFFDEEQLRGKASDFGEGVSYVSGMEIKKGSREGYIVTYAFKDINKITISQNPNSRMPQGFEEDSEETDEENVRFTFSGGDPALLEVHFIDFNLDEEAEIEDTLDTALSDTLLNDQMLGQLAGIMKDMRIALEIETAGSIVETNAAYINESRVTLFDINFNELLAQKEKFDKFKKVQPRNFEEIKEILKDIPGIKIEFNNPVIIKYK